MLNLKKEQYPIFAVNIIILVIFSFIFISKKNYEFIAYIGVILFFLMLILLTNKRVDYNRTVLWGLTLWSAMHMSGGGLVFSGKRLYEMILIPIVGEPFLIFKYDQLVHIVGFGVATLLMYFLLRPSLDIKKLRWVSMSIVVLMAGLGVGAMNEIIEFTVAVIVPNTGVGGYYNTSLDLVSDLIGGLVAWLYIWFVEKR